jgi:hypothetical protein
MRNMRPDAPIYTTLANLFDHLRHPAGQLAGHPGHTDHTPQRPRAAEHPAHRLTLPASYG